MARIQVQDLSEKLELADVDFLHIKDGVTGIDYKFTFSNFELPNGNSTKQIVSSLGDVAFDDVVPIARGGTGSSTASGARTNLGLGTAALRDISTTQISNWDTAFSWGNHADAGYATTSSLGTAAFRNVGESSSNVMEVGAFGWGSNISYQQIDLNDYKTDRYTAYGITSTNKPANSTGFIFAKQLGSTRANQLAYTFTGEVHSRFFDGAVWTDWRTMWDNINLPDYRAFGLGSTLNESSSISDLTADGLKTGMFSTPVGGTGNPSSSNYFNVINLDRSSEATRTDLDSQIAVGNDSTMWFRFDTSTQATWRQVATTNSAQTITALKTISVGDDENALAMTAPSSQLYILNGSDGYCNFLNGQSDTGGFTWSTRDAPDNFVRMRLTNVGDLSVGRDVSVGRTLSSASVSIEGTGEVLNALTDGTIAARFRGTSNGSDIITRYQARQVGGNQRYADIKLDPDAEAFVLMSPNFTSPSIDAISIFSSGDVRFSNDIGVGVTPNGSYSDGFGVQALSLGYIQAYRDGGVCLSLRRATSSGTVQEIRNISNSVTYTVSSDGDVDARDITGRNIDATGYLRGSDPTLKDRKQVVSDITREDLDSIALYYFRWKEMEQVDQSIQGTEDIGVMADEVQRVFPECVTTRSNGTLAVDYAKFATCFTLADYKLRREGK